MLDSYLYFLYQAQVVPCIYDISVRYLSVFVISMLGSSLCLCYQCQVVPCICDAIAR